MEYFVGAAIAACTIWMIWVTYKIINLSADVLLGEDVLKNHKEVITAIGTQLAQDAEVDEERPQMGFVVEK